MEPALASANSLRAVSRVPGDLQWRSGAGYARERIAVLPQVALARGAAIPREGDVLIRTLFVLQQAAVGRPAEVPPWKSQITEPILEGPLQ